jgi:hypothetical protein
MPMLYATFRSPMRTENQVCHSARDPVVIAGQIMTRKAPRGFVAELRNTTWWLNDEPYTTAEIVGHATVSFPSGPTLGPFFRLKVVNDHLYSGDTMLARRQDKTWVATADCRAYERIVISPEE